MSKLAPRAKASKPIDEAEISASQFANLLVVRCSLFVVFSLETVFPKMYKLKIVPSPDIAEPNRAANSETPNSL